MLKKKAFSYIELLFGMVIVVVIFSASVPFITKKSQSQPALPGTFMCFSAYDDDFGGFRLFQTMQRGAENFTELADVTDVGGCVFYKQKNINSYNVTVVGGGGAANKLLNNRVTLGEDGQTIQILNTTLAGVWDENNAIEIKACRNSGLKNAVMPYEKEFDYCVGDGGFAHRNKVLGSTQQDEQTYTELLGVYHDVLYEARTNVDTVNYVGLGNGVLDADDLNALNILTNSTNKTNVINGVRRYLNLNPAARTSVSEKERLFVVARTLRNLILNNSYTANGNHGGQGGYSRFVVYDKHPLDCLNGFGDCVARGGIGGGFDGTDMINVDANDGEAVNGSLAAINNIIDEGTRDKSELEVYLGKAGGYSEFTRQVIPGVEQVVSDRKGATEAQCDSWWSDYERYSSLVNRVSRLIRNTYISKRNAALNSYNSHCCSCSHVERTPDRIIEIISDSPVANGGAIIINW